MEMVGGLDDHGKGTVRGRRTVKNLASTVCLKLKRERVRCSEISNKPYQNFLTEFSRV